MLDEMLAAVAGLSGDYAEAGVWRGEVAQYIAERMPPETALWLFDSFEGHPEPGEFDDAIAHPKGRYADTDIDSVRNRIEPILDAKYCFLWIVPGFMPETFKHMGVAGCKFRFVRVDVDHYASTKCVIEFFRDKMVRGGIMEFDDYNHNECPGATKAIDEIIGRENVRMPAHWVHA